MNCPKCDKSIEVKHAKFCYHCGFHLPEEKMHTVICTDCRKEHTYLVPFSVFPKKEYLCHVCEAIQHKRKLEETYAEVSSKKQVSGEPLRQGGSSKLTRTIRQGNPEGVVMTFNTAPGGVIICPSCDKPLHNEFGFAKCGCK
ncbi:hypothetical protein ABLO26_24415 [Neobacillus sp. 179-J 1A1 HS]|uniref:hypothetical protein n=1 Tax=Neobacillus driksii TaxID=3035913 RepID=UPI0035BC422E